MEISFFSGKSFTQKEFRFVIGRLLVSMALPLTGIPLLIYADISITKGQWQIFPGALVVILSILLAFVGLNIRVLPYLGNGKTIQKWGLIFGIVPVVPVLVVIASGGFSLDNPYLIRGLVILSAGIFCLSLRRGSPTFTNFEWSGARNLILLDFLRQGFLMLIVMLGGMVYVSAPSLVITLSLITP